MREKSPAQCATGGFADLAGYIHFGDILPPPPLRPADPHLGQDHNCGEGYLLAELQRFH